MQSDYQIQSAVKGLRILPGSQSHSSDMKLSSATLVWYINGSLRSDLRD